MNVTLGDIARKVVKMKMQTLKAGRSPHLGVEIILICITGIAVAMGWIPA